VKLGARLSDEVALLVAPLGDYRASEGRVSDAPVDLVGNVEREEVADVGLVNPGQARGGGNDVGAKNLQAGREEGIDERPTAHRRLEHHLSRLERKQVADCSGDGRLREVGVVLDAVVASG
jgi:hypothetical protein